MQANQGDSGTAGERRQRVINTPGSMRLSGLARAGTGTSILTRRERA